MRLSRNWHIPRLANPKLAHFYFRCHWEFMSLNCLYTLIGIYLLFWYQKKLQNGNFFYISWFKIWFNFIKNMIIKKLRKWKRRALIKIKGDVSYFLNWLNLARSDLSTYYHQWLVPAVDFDKNLKWSQDLFHLVFYKSNRDQICLTSLNLSSF